MVELDSGGILTENLQDRSFRAGLSLADYKPIRNPEAAAWEWFSMDFEYAQTPVCLSVFLNVAVRITYRNRYRQDLKQEPSNLSSLCV